MESELRLLHVQHIATAADLVISLIEDDQPSRNPDLLRRIEEADKSILCSALASLVAVLLANRDYRALLTKWVEEASGGVK